MARKTTKLRTRNRLLVTAVATCFAVSAQALPSAPTVVNGSASFAQAGNVLNVTNSNGAIINWNTFSIGANETTRFLQPSVSSSVLNRVLASDPSVILGTLTSNGRVFLINPNGIYVGQGARIDVAGFVASALNISDANFLANKLTFDASPASANPAGSVVNKGSITTPSGGSVYLVAPNVSNEGIITTPQGETLLAAGQSVTLLDTATPGVSVEIVGAQGNATNLGQIVAEAGRIGIVGVIVRNSGTLNASSVVNEGGRIFLKAAQNITLDDTSVIAADGSKGGNVVVKVEDGGQLSGTLTGRGLLSARGDGRVGSGGFVEISAANLDINGINVDTHGGTWLLDPVGVCLYLSTSSLCSSYTQDSAVSWGSLNLTATNVIVTTTGGGGNIDIVEGDSFTSSYNLSLLAQNNLTANNVSIINSGSGSMTLVAGWDGSSTTAPTATAGTGTLAINTTGTIKTSGGNITLLAGQAININGYYSANTLDSGGGNINLQTNESTSSSGGINITASSGTSNLSAGSGTLNVTAGPAGMNVISYGQAVAITAATFNVDNLTVSSGDGLSLNGTANVGNLNLIVNPAINTYGGSIANNSGPSPYLGSSVWNVSSSMNWSGPSAIDQIGSGTNVVNILSGATLAITTAASGNPYQQHNATVNNYGNATLSGNGTLSVGNGSTTTFNNEVGATFTITDNSGIALGIFNNAGNLSKTGGTGVSKLDSGGSTGFNNTGVVNVNSGTLQLNSGGTDTGSYSLASGTTLDLSSGTRSFNSGASVTGTGLLSLSGATVNFNTGSTITPSSLTLSNGTLQGTGDVSTGNFNWSSGTIQGGGNFNTNGVTTLNPTGSVYLYGTRVWNNSGTVNQTGTGNLYMYSGTPVVNNLAGAIWNEGSTNTSYVIEYGTFNNAGSFNKTGSNTAQIYGTVFNNTATSTNAVNVNAGDLQLNTGTSTDSGNYVVASGATLEFDGGTRNWSTGTAFSGNGTVQVSSSGTVSVNATVSTPSSLAFSVAGGTVQGNSDLTLAGAFNWSSGTIQGGGNFNTSGVTTLNPTGSVYLYGTRVWNNSGTVNQTGTGNLYMYSGTPVVNNLAGAIWNEGSTNTSYVIEYGTFNNAGSFNKTGSNTAQIYGTVFNNTATSTNAVNVNAGDLQLNTGTSTDSGNYVVASGATLEFDGGTRNWSTGTAFSGNGTVQVSSSGTVSVNATVSTPSSLAFSVAGGTVQGNSDLTLAGAFNWSSGTIQGGGNFNTSGVTTLNPTGSVYLYGTRVWNNSGTVNQTGTGNLYMYSGTPVVNNLAGAIWNEGSTNTSYVIEYGTFNNAGSFNKTGSNTAQIYGTAFNNTAASTNAVNVNAGDLQLNTGTSTDSGNYVVASGATLEFDGGTRNWSTGTAFSGNGTVQVSSSGTVSVNATVSTPSSLAFSVAGGTVQGNSDLTLAGAFNWSSGTIQGGGNFNTSGVTTLNPTGSVYLYGTRVWNNSGTVNQTGTGNLYMYSGTPVVNNLAGAIWNEGSTNTSYVIEYGTFNNAGSFNKTGSNTAQIYGTAFNNTATSTNAVNVNAGDLQLNTGTSTDSGNYVVASGATLEFDGGTRSLNGGTNISGAGNLLFSGATVNANTGAIVSALNNITISSGTLNQNTGSTFAAINLTMTGGTLQGTGDVSVSGNFNWPSGTIQGSGNLNTSGTATLNPASSVTLAGTRVWNNSGTVNQSGTGYLYMASGTPVVNNLAGAVWNEGSTNSSVLYYGTFNNAGTFNKSGSNTAQIYGTVFNNTASGADAVNVSAGDLQLNTGTSTDSGNYAIASGATLEFYSGTRNLNPGTAFTGAGAMVWSGTLNFNTPISIGNAAATLTLNNVTINGSAVNTLGTANSVLIPTGNTTIGSNTVWNSSGSVNATSGGWIYLNSGAAWYNSGNVTLGGNIGVYEYAGASFNNLASGSITLNGIYSSPITGSGAFTFANAGTLTKAVGSVATQTIYNASNTSTGNIVVNSGTLNVDGGSGTNQSGTFNAGSGAVLQLQSTNNLLAGTSFSGSGGVTWTGTVNLSSPLSIASSAPTLTLNGVTINGSTTNSLTTANGISVPSGSFTLGSGLVWNNNGSMVITSGSSATINNTAILNNAGSIDIGNNFDFYLYSGGQFNNQAAGTVTLSGIYSSPITGSGSLANTGTLTKTSTATQSLSGTTNTGVININAGTLNAGFVSNANSGTVNIAAGAILITSGSPLINNGIVEGSGTVNLGSGTLTNNGSLLPGSAGTVGTLSITGNYIQGTSGSLNLDLASSTNYDVLVVTGSVTTGGTLNAALVNGYVPLNGDALSFLTMTGTATGTFATTNLPANFNVGYNLAAGEAARLVATASNNVFFNNSQGNLDWGTALNWTGGALPTSSENVLISTGPGFAVTHAYGTDTVGTLTITNTNSLNVSGGSLLVLGTSALDGVLTVSGTGTTQLNGTLAGNGTLNVLGGILTANASTSINTLNILGGILTGSGNVSVANNYSQTAGVINSTGALSITQTSGNLNLGQISAKSIVATAPAGSVTLNGTLNANSAGDAVVLAGTGFVNNVGSTAISVAGGGRWLVWSGNPTSDTVGGLSYAFKQYNAPYSVSTTVLGSGNGLLYSYAPSLTVALTNTGVSKTYDGTTNAPAGFVPTASVSGFVAGDIVTIDYATATYAYQNAHVAYANNYLNASGLSWLPVTDANGKTVYGYQLPATASSAPGSASITVAPLTITANNASKTYGQTATFAGTAFTSSGLQNSESIGSVTETSTGAAATAHVLGSPYAIVASGVTGGSFTASDYAISYTNGNLTVNTAPLTITANNAVKTYGQTATFAGTAFTSSGLQNSETIGSVSETSTGAAATAHVLGSPYAIVASGATGGSFTASDYAISYTNGNLTLNAAPLSSTATIGGTTTKVYDGTTAATGATINAGSVTGAVNGDTLTLNTSGVTLAYNSAHVVGATSIGATGSAGLTIGSSAGSLASDYSFTAPTISPVAGNISAAPLTATAAIGGTTTKVYDGTTAATGATIGGSVTGAVAGDVLTLTTSGLTLAYNSAHVIGATSIGATGSAGFTIGSSTAGSLATDYSFTGPTISPVAGSISAAPLTATAAIGGTTTKVYDGTTAATGATVGSTVNGAISGDVLALTTSGVTLAYNSAHVIGATSIGATGSTGFTIGSSTAGSQTTDYSFTSPTISSVAGNITAKTLTASLTNTGVTKPYDGTTTASFTPTYSVSGLLSGDTAASFTTTSQDYNSAHVASASYVTAGGLSVSGITGGLGSLASDYSLGTVTSLSSAAGSASITPSVLTVNGNWSTPASWIGSLLPQNTDVLGVLIPSSTNVTFDGVGGPTSVPYLTSAGKLTMTGGALTVAGAFTTVDYAQTGGALTAASVDINSAGAISQTGGSLATPTLTTLSVGGTTLNGANAIGSISAGNSGSGDITLTNTGALSIAGIGNSAGNIVVSNAGPVSLDNGSQVYTSTGTVTLDVLNASSLTLDNGSVINGNQGVFIGASGVSLNHASTIQTGPVATANVEMVISDGDVTLDNGSSILAGHDAIFTFTGPTAQLVLNSAPGETPSTIKTDAALTTHINFLARTSGGIVIDGTPSTATADGSSGFYALGKPAAIGNGIEIVYPVTSSSSNDVASQVIDQYFAQITQTATTSDATDTTSEEDGHKKHSDDSGNNEGNHNNENHNGKVGQCT